jgi:predicted nuclease with TOPRIM domain
MPGETKVSTPAEIEQLHNEKARLEEESRHLDEELKRLDAYWKVLEEKVAIQELKNENVAKQKAINQLRSKISTMETQLEKSSATNFPKNETTTLPEKVHNQEFTKESSEVSQGKDDDTITITALDSEEHIRKTLESEQQERKKQGLFF